MKILYVIEVSLSLDNINSVFKKVLSQIEYWQGHRVIVYSLRSGVLYDAHTNTLDKIGVEYLDETPAISKFIKLQINSRALSRYMHTCDIDLIYSRSVLYSPYLHKVFSRYKTIMEINADDFIEYKLECYSSFTRFYNGFLGSILINNCNGLVFLTHELKNNMSYRLKETVKSTVIANGCSNLHVDFPSVSESNNRPNLVFVISPNLPWNGLERVLKIADSLPEYDFNIIGESGLGRDNIKYHGYLDRDKLIEKLSSADFGISTMALELQGMTEASPLKSREYFSFGLPCFGNYDDTDFILNDGVTSIPPLHLKIDEPLDVDRSCTQIRSFVTSWLSLDDRKNKVIRVAEQRVSDERKEAERIIFLKEIVSIYD